MNMNEFEQIKPFLIDYSAPGVLFQDTEGKIPVTSEGQRVGMIINSQGTQSSQDNMPQLRE